MDLKSLTEQEDAELMLIEDGELSDDLMRLHEELSEEYESNEVILANKTLYLFAMIFIAIATVAFLDKKYKFIPKDIIDPNLLIVGITILAGIVIANNLKRILSYYNIEDVVRDKKDKLDVEQ